MSGGRGGYKHLHPAEVSPSSQAARAAAGLSGADSTWSTERNRGQIGLHGTLRRRRSGESRALVSGEEPTHNNSGRGALVSYRQREMGAGGQGTHYLYQPAGVHCGCGRKRLCSRSGCGAGMALGLGARAAVRCAAAEAPSSCWLGSAPPRATRRHLKRRQTAPEPASTASHVIRNCEFPGRKDHEA